MGVHVGAREGIREGEGLLEAIAISVSVLATPPGVEPPAQALIPQRRITRQANLRMEELYPP